MKNSFVITLLLGIITLLGFTACDQGEEIILDNTPVEIQSYVDTHFPANGILQVAKEVDQSVVTFEVTLEQNIELEFNAAKEITEIDSVTELPDSVIPAKIREYVQAKYSGQFITDWELENGEQHVELDNGTELEFDRDDNFLRVDN